ncbi:MAG: DUF512 domain-containing protein [Acidimicrobiia bacterium]
MSAFSSEPEMREHTLAEAEAVLDAVHTWQERYLGALGRRLVYAADEYYLMAHGPFPVLAEYDGAPQHENGIGMATTFADEVARAIAGHEVAGIGARAGFFASVEGAPAAGYRAPRASGASLAVVDASRDAHVALVTGEYGARVLEPLLPALRSVARGPVRLLPVANRFFGGNIAVTGLLTATDVAAALADEPPDHRYLVPDVVLSDDRFLDGGRVADLPRPVEIVRTDGASLVAALQGVQDRPDDGRPTALQRVQDRPDDERPTALAVRNDPDIRNS